MIRTKELIEYLETIKLPLEPDNQKVREYTRIIIRRLKDFDALKKGVDYLHSDMVAGELFEEQE